GFDDDQDGRDHDRDDPADPVHAGAAVAPERGVDEPAEHDSADAAEDGQPDRDVVLVARSDELAQQPDDDARDDDADDLHEVSLPVKTWPRWRPTPVRTRRSESQSGLEGSAGVQPERARAD